MSRARIILLEHHRDLREALVEALVDEGHAVTPAPSAEAALQAVRAAGDSQPPDAIVLDAQDGHDLVALLRADPSYDRIALVTLSFALDPPSDADVDVRRPFGLDEFLQAVRAALEGRAGAPDALHPPTP